MSRLPIKKTYKLFIGGSFPRSESGRTMEADGHHVDVAARQALPVRRAALEWLRDLGSVERQDVDVGALELPVRRARLRCRGCRRRRSLRRGRCRGR